MNKSKILIEEYEKSYNVTITQVLKFNILNNFFSMLLPRYYNDTEDFTFPIINSLVYKINEKEELCITDIIRKENLSFYLDTFCYNMEKDILKNFFPISLEVFPYSSWLLIGINDKNYNEVWMTSPGAGSDLIFLQNNFYDFFNNLRPIYSEDFKKYNFYKNYDEDFWRIKQDKMPLK
ncbi:hypothetical protein ACILD6_06005 [Capnocytophaga canimorsus]|uniref:hypothetical protein n=1 Tax=Capnocytophaga canimorsus TaxID=28188 RepID=UPI0037D18219